MKQVFALHDQRIFWDEVDQEFWVYGQVFTCIKAFSADRRQFMRVSKNIAFRSPLEALEEVMTRVYGHKQDERQIKRLAFTALCLMAED